MKKKNVTSKSQQIKQMDEELTTLFGEKSYVVIRKPCSGKYHGHNDYTIVFGSGRHLYVGLDKRNYARNLQSHLEEIRAFRANQEDNRKKIKAAVLAKSNQFSDVRVEIRPYEDTMDLTLYAVVILVLQNNQEFIYRSTNMHYYLVGAQRAWCGYEYCLDQLMSSLCGTEKE